MKKKVFTRSIRVLIVLLLAMAVLAPREHAQTAMVVMMVAWLLVMAAIYLGRFMKSFRKGRPVWVSKQKGKKSEIHHVSGTDGKEAGSKAYQPAPDPLVSEYELELMMQQVSLRISEKIKSAYPDAVWQWDKKASLSDMLKGTTVRIKVEDMAEYSHADITFDRFGRIRVEPLTMGCFGAVPGTAETATEEPADPSVVDVRAWYELIGQKVLENQIVELNANGHSKLVIKENGDIVIQRQKKEALVTTMEAFPGKAYWKELVSILEENELKARIAGDTLQVSWIV